MTTSLLDQLLASPPAVLPPAPWGELERIDTAVSRAAARLQEAPWLLAHLLPALESLASERRRCWRSWLAAGDTCDPALLRVTLDSRTLGPGGEPVASEPEPTETAPGLAEAAPEPAMTPPSPPESGVIPARTAEPAPVPEVPPVSTEQLQAFVSNFGKRRFTSPLAYQKDPQLCRREEMVRGILARLGEIPERIERVQVAGWRERLEAVTSEVELRRWSELDGALQVDLLSLVAALGRAVQEAGGAQQEPRKVFSRLTAYSQREQPGFAHGMARQHQPRHGSWLQDARKAREALRRWLGEPEETRGPPASSAPKSVVAATPEPPEETGDDPQALIENDWPWWPQVQGKRAILIGGSPREMSRLRLQEAFRLGELDWVDGEVRRIESVTEQIRHGSLDLVLVVSRFLSHKISKKVLQACKSQKIPHAVLESGHGVLAARRAIERYLQATGTRATG